MKVREIIMLCVFIGLLVMGGYFLKRHQDNRRVGCQVMCDKQLTECMQSSPLNSDAVRDCTSDQFFCNVRCTSK